MSENLDIKDLGLLTSASDNDRILMTHASEGHTAKAMTVAVLKKAMGFMRATNANGYYGLTNPEGNSSNWIRTTVYGIIPYQSGGASALGTSSWPFNNAFINTLNCKQLVSTIATGTAPMTVASTTVVKNLNADLLDGIHSSSFARGGTASFVPAGTAAARWIRIAKFVNYNSYGIISLQNHYYTNAPNSVTLVFNTGYRNNSLPSITQIGGMAGIFTQARIVYPTATNPSTTDPGYIEVYYNTTSITNTINLRLSNALNCSLMTSYQAGSVPEGFASKAWGFVNDGISAPNIKTNNILVNSRLLINSSGHVYPNATSYRSAGMYGMYESAKIGHIWSMGTTYKIPDDGSNFGTLYGMAYKHTNNKTGGTMASGHQIVFCYNGIPGVSIGFTGNIWAKGEISANQASDQRLKTNQTKLNGLDLLRKVNAYEFDWTDEALEFKMNKTRRDQGVIAQELQSVAPDFIREDMWGKGFLGVDYGKFTPYLIAGINEIDHEVASLKNRIGELEKKLSVYEKGSSKG